MMDTDAKEQRRAVNRATYAVLCDAYCSATMKLRVARQSG
jgi:hypothetical protein